MVNEEVEAEKLEAVLAPIGIDLLLHGGQRQRTQILHLLHNVDIEIDATATLHDNTLQFSEGKLVAVFVGAVLGRVLLDGVVGQVHEVVVQVLGRRRVGLT